MDIREKIESVVKKLLSDKDEEAIVTVYTSRKNIIFVMGEDCLVSVEADSDSSAEPVTFLQLIPFIRGGNVLELEKLGQIHVVAHYRRVKRQVG